MFSAFTLRKLRSEDSKVRQVALTQLKSLDNPKVLDEVIRMMVEDRNGPVRDEAAKAIERTKPAGAPERLRPLLGHQDPQRRYSAARTLHGIGWSPATTRERAELAVGLGKCDLAAQEGEAALESLALESTSATKGEARTAALDALAVIGEPAVPQLLAIFRSSNLSGAFKKGALVAHSVAKRPGKVSEIFFLEALKAPDANTEALCAALAETPVPGATTALIGVLHDSSKGTEVRRAAAVALVKSGSEATVSALSTTLRHDATADPRLRSEVALLLGQAKMLAAVPDLVAALAADTSEKVRASAAVALGILGDATAKDALMNALSNDPDKGVALAAVESLRLRLKVPVAIEPLLDLLQSLRESGYDAGRASLVRMLGEIRDQRATRPLIELLESDSYEACRERCARALGNIGGRDAILALEKVPFPSKGGTKYQLWASAQEALNEIGGQKGKWRAVYGGEALREAVSLRIISNDTLTEFPPMTAVAKVAREEDRRPFKVCGMVNCRQCGTEISFQVSAGAGAQSSTLQCYWCQSQMSLLISKHPQLGWLTFFVCGSPLRLRGGELSGSPNMHIAAVGVG